MFSQVYAPSTKWGHSEKLAIYEAESDPEQTRSVSALILDFLASKTVRNKSSLIEWIRNEEPVLWHSGLNLFVKTTPHIEA